MATKKELETLLALNKQPHRPRSETNVVSQEKLMQMLEDLVPLSVLLHKGYVNQQGFIIGGVRL